MAINLRTTKGSALTHLEMDTNLTSFYVSSSLSGSTLNFYTHGTGSFSATTHSVDLQSFLDEDSRAISTGTLNGVTGIVTFTRDDASTFTLDLSDLLDDTNLVTSVNESAGAVEISLQSVCDIDSTTTTTIEAANFITTSDKRLKSDIKPIQEGLETIKKFVSYEYIKDGVQDAGFLAQEVQEAIPYSIGEREDGFLTMRDRPVLAHMHKAILELEARLAAIEEKLQ